MVKVPPELYGISIKEIARICAVSEKTAGRWKAGTACPPKTALWILSGDLGYLSPEWRGWVVRGPDLVSPEGWQITIGDVLASPLMRSQLAIYQSENRRLKQELENLEGPPENQPEPASSADILAEVKRLLG